MKRVQQTLAPLLKNGAPAQTILPGLCEVDFGDWTGFNWEEVRKKFGVHPYDWLDEIELGAVPNGETGDVYKRQAHPFSKSHRALRCRLDACRMGQHACHLRRDHRGNRAALDEGAGGQGRLDHRRILDASLFLSLIHILRFGAGQ